MGQKTILLFVMCLMLLLWNAQTSAQTLVLHHANGTTTDVQLFTMPQVTFVGNKVLIKSTVLDMEYPKEDILRFTYTGGTLGISTPQTKAIYTKEGGQLVFHGIKNMTKIAVYTSNGIRVPVHVSRNGSTATLSLSEIPSGVSLLNVNGRTSKFIKP